MSKEIENKVVSCYSEEPFPGIFHKSDNPELEYQKINKWFQANFDVLHLDSVCKPKNILIVGCGTGEEVVIMARKFPQSRILAIDITQESLTIAIDNIKEMRVNNVEFKLVSIFDLNCINEEFDLVFCSGVIHHLFNPEMGFRNLTELVSSEGYMLITLYHSWGLLIYRTQRLFLNFITRSNNIKEKLAKTITFGKYNRTILFDGYLHPQVTSFSIQTIYKWGIKNNMNLFRISPPLQPRYLLGFGCCNASFVNSRRFLNYILRKLLGIFSQNPVESKDFKNNWFSLLIGQLIFAIVRKGECWYLFKKGEKK